MEAEIKIWQNTRKNLIGFIDYFGEERLNKIPDGFNNNLIWNIAHIIAVQQRVIFSASETPIVVPQHIIDNYKPGTVPSGTNSKEDIAAIRELLASTIDSTIALVNNKKNLPYHEFTTKTGAFHISNLIEAFAFNNFHEAMHLGQMMILRKKV